MVGWAPGCAGLFLRGWDQRLSRCGRWSRKACALIALCSETHGQVLAAFDGSADRLFKHDVRDPIMVKRESFNVGLAGHISCEESEAGREVDGGDDACGLQ